MSLLKDARKHASSFAQGGEGEGERDYILGIGGIPMENIYWGADPNVYSPEEYGDYVLTSNPVYSCVDQRARYLASLPFRLYRFTGESALLQVPRLSSSNNGTLREIMGILEKTRGPSLKPTVRNAIVAMHSLHDGDKVKTFTRQMGMEEVVDGPAFDLLHYVNDFWSNPRLIRMTSLSRDLWGQSYWVINRGDTTLGEPEEIWWVPQAQMRPIPHPKRYISHYEFDPLDGGKPEIFFPWEVVRIFNANPLDQFQPLSALSSTHKYADHETASMQSNQNLHEHGLNPGAIVMPINKIKWDLGQARDVEEDINTRLGGVDKAHRWGVFRHEVKIHQSGITPRESEFIEGMNYDLESVARAYDWPIDLLAGKRTYENVEMAFKRAWQTTAMEGAFVASDIAEFLLPMFDTDEILVPFFDTSNIAVLQETESVKWEREMGQIDKVITRNEWRQGRGLAAIEGGDSLYIPSTSVPLEMIEGMTEDIIDGEVEEDPPLLEDGEEDSDLVPIGDNGAQPV